MNEESDEISPYPQESILIDALPNMSGARLLCTSPGLAQFAVAAARSLPQASVACTYLDLYRANLAKNYWQDLLPNLNIECAEDLPAEEADAVALPLAANGEAELARDFIQAAHERLAIGGKLFASSNNRDDTWLGDTLSKLFRRIERRTATKGVLYVATKSEPLKKRKDYSCEFAFRDRGRLIRAVSRPGVFSHRHIDPGARRLIDAMEIGPGERVLDIGCGSGVVALAAACRSEGVRVHAVDSNIRAVRCFERAAVLNEFSNVTTELNADGSFLNSGQYDLALANPPYYSGFRIAQHFLTSGREALRPGGQMIVVTKHPKWYEENMPEWFDGTTMAERKGYFVFHGVRPT